MLSDGDHGHEPAGTGSDHLRPVVRDGQQQRSQIIIAVQDQLTLKGVARSKAEVSRSSASRACSKGEVDLEVGPSRRRRA